MTWNKCSDEQPAKDGLYMVYAPSADPDKPVLALAWYHTKGYWSLLPKVWCLAITHWMEMPQPPEE
jgi:hypothetical protein